MSRRIKSLALGAAAALLIAERAGQENRGADLLKLERENRAPEEHEFVDAYPKKGKRGGNGRGRKWWNN